jgi:hypothetical protein
MKNLFFRKKNCLLQSALMRRPTEYLFGRLIINEYSLLIIIRKLMPPVNCHHRSIGGLIKEDDPMELVYAGIVVIYRRSPHLLPVSC